MPNISHIVKYLESSVLIIGPEILCDNDGNSVVSGFIEKYIKSSTGLIESYSFHDNLIRPANESAHDSIQEDFADFFENKFPEKVLSLYQRIAQIPFPLVISLNPDTTLLTCLKELNIEPKFDFYQKGIKKKYEPDEVPTKDNPSLYNLLGCWSRPESLVLTHDDLFEYLRNILNTGSLPENIRSKLKDARNIIFLGIQFDKWYFQLLVKLLTEYDDRFKMLRYASPDLQKQEEIKTLCRDNFKITFVGPQVENFINEIYYKCFEKKMLRGEFSGSDLFIPEIFISYKRVEESEAIVNKLSELSAAKGYRVIQDKKELKYKEKIRLFMDRLGWGKYIIAVIGDEYLKSEFCMYELLEINRNGDLVKRLFPVVIKSDIFSSTAGEEFDNYWKSRIEELRNLLRNYVSLADLYESIHKIELFEEIRKTIPEIIITLKERNLLNIDIHFSEDFSSLFEAIQKQIDEDKSF